MSPLAITCLVMLGSVVLFLSDRLRPDIIAMLVLLTLGLSGVLTDHEALSGFSRSAVIIMLAVFVLAEGLLRAGAADRIGGWLLRVAGTRETRLVGGVMAAGALLSLFMNNIAAASVLMPAVAGAARRAKVSPSRLLMPLAFSTLLGGMGTLFTTTNLIASAVLRDAGHVGFGVFSFASLGLPMLVFGVLYMTIWGRRLLPAQANDSRQEALDEANADLVEVYRLGKNLFRARVPEGSVLHGRTIADCQFRGRLHVSVLGIERGSDEVLSPAPDAVVREGDVLVLKGDFDDFRSRDTQPYLEILPSPPWTEERVSAPQDVLVEAMLSPRSALIGKTLQDVRFRARYGFNVLAIYRAGERLRVGVRHIVLQFGDALLLQGPRAQTGLLADEADFLLLAEEEELERFAPATPARRVVAVAIFVITLALAAIFQQHVAELMLAGAVAMAMCGVMSMDDAYRAVDWKSIFVVAGLLPLGLAMSKTGAAQQLAGAVVASCAPFGPQAVLTALSLVALLLTQVMGGSAVVALVAPVAVQAALSAGLDPRAMVMGVALATSMAFLTPLGHPVNVLVMGQGGYRFRDYGRVGAGLTVGLFVLLVVLLAWLWPLQPR